MVYRYTYDVIPFTFDGINDLFDWMHEVSEKHRDSYHEKLDKTR